MDFVAIRKLMVDNQIRPNKVNDPKILDLFKSIKKELYLPENKRNIAYIDNAIELINKKFYLPNLQIAKLIQAANLNKIDKVLHIGSLSGYVTEILSKLSKRVVAVESDDELFKTLSKNIKEFNINNVLPINNNYKDGYSKENPYDVIFIDSVVDFIPDILYNQLSDKNGRLLTIKKINSSLSNGIMIIKNDNNYFKEYLFDSFIQISSLFKLDESFKF